MSLIPGQHQQDGHQHFQQNGDPGRWRVDHGPVHQCLSDGWRYCPPAKEQSGDRTGWDETGLIKAKGNF